MQNAFNNKLFFMNFLLEEYLTCDSGGIQFNNANDDLVGAINNFAAPSTVSIKNDGVNCYFNAVGYDGYYYGEYSIYSKNNYIYCDILSNVPVSDEFDSLNKNNFIIDNILEAYTDGTNIFNFNMRDGGKVSTFFDRSISARQFLEFFDVSNICPPRT